jgi:3-deoxy-manno-octulosonate cytidylyltransferase (CMP-KDO synthetase)
MIEYVYRATVASPLITDAFVATCDEDIRSSVVDFGGQAVMTGSHHERASDRCAEAVGQLAARGVHYDIVIMIQGDEPMTHPEQMTEVLTPFGDADVNVVNLYASLGHEDAASKNVVKVVIDQHGNAMYFSRLPIPGSMGAPTVPTGKQLGLIAFRTRYLETFAALAPTPYEISESVDMLRFLEHGIPIRMQLTRHATVAVDTPSDLESVVQHVRPPSW